MSDEPQLIRAAQKRDMGAFGILVQRHYVDVKACLAVRLRNPHDAEDLTQEAFLTAFRKIGDCDPDLPLRPWLRGIAMKLLANFRRKNRPEPVGLHEELESLLLAGMEKEFRDEGEGSVLEALVECLEKIQGPARALLRARYEDGVTLEELSAEVGKKPSAVSMQLHRIRLSLGECVRFKTGKEPGYGIG